MVMVMVLHLYSAFSICIFKCTLQVVDLWVKTYLSINLVPRSHSVTRNDRGRSGYEITSAYAANCAVCLLETTSLHEECSLSHVVTDGKDGDKLQLKSFFFNSVVIAVSVVVS